MELDEQFDLEFDEQLSGLIGIEPIVPKIKWKAFLMERHSRLALFVEQQGQHLLNSSFLDEIAQEMTLLSEGVRSLHSGVKSIQEKILQQFVQSRHSFWYVVFSCVDDVGRECQEAADPFSFVVEKLREVKYIIYSFQQLTDIGTQKTGSCTLPTCK